MKTEKRNVDPAILRFGDRFLDMLIATEIVSRGAGPAKYLSKDAKYQNTILFDTCVLEVDELPDIWHDRDIYATREIALTHPDDRKSDFEDDFREARIQVWKKFQGLYLDSYRALEEIKDPLLKEIRLSELESLKANYDFAGYNLGLSENLPSFMASQLIITGNYYVPTKESLDAMAEELSEDLSKIGFSGKDLAEKVNKMEKSQTYIDEEKVVEVYENLIKRFSEEANRILGTDKDFIDINVQALPKTENKTGSFEYEGNGKARTSIRVSKTMTLPSAVYVTAHELTHLVDAIIREFYFNSTGDLYGAPGMMCTSSAAVNEGMGEMGSMLYSSVVAELLKGESWFIDFMNKNSNLAQSVLHYSAKLAYREIYLKKSDPAEVAKRLEKINISYGMDEESSRVRANGIANDINRQHKNIFYTPYYGLDRQIIDEQFKKMGKFNSAFDVYKNFVIEKSPLTLVTLPMVFSIK